VLSSYPQATAGGTTCVSTCRRELATGKSQTSIGEGYTGVCVSSSPMVGPCSISPHRSSRQLSHIVDWTPKPARPTWSDCFPFFRMAILLNGTNGTRIQHARISARRDLLCSPIYVRPSHRHRHPAPCTLLRGCNARLRPSLYVNDAAVSPTLNVLMYMSNSTSTMLKLTSDVPVSTWILVSSKASMGKGSVSQ
jgi:hypothetical protein